MKGVHQSVMRTPCAFINIMGSLATYRRLLILTTILGFEKLVLNLEPGSSPALVMFKESVYIKKYK